ncbi:MAG TPA: VWA domain-containing protein [Blastocatellia bacterium]|nr:VWA domain-containing protein [Blastocatellia bacterium]
MNVRSRIIALLLAVSSVALPMQSFSSDDQALRIRTDLVSLHVTVTARDGSPLTGLQRDDFELYEDGVRQEIAYFSDVDQPATIGVIFDHSGSMRRRLAPARAALQMFAEASHPEDEYFLVNFNERVGAPLEVEDSTAVLRRLQGLTPEGNTALYDAIYRGLERLRESRHQRRALLIVTDGVDNHSRYSLRDVQQQLREANVMIYVLGTPEPSSSDCGRICHFEATARLDNLAAMSGGKAFFPHSAESFEQAVSQIAVELRRQYSLGYVPSTPRPTGGWRKIKVRLKPESVMAKVSVRARTGYFAFP